MNKKTDINLRIPGPTPLPPEVRKALGRQIINHRGKSYEEIHERVVTNLKHFFQTKNDIYLLTSSGMGGLEAAVANFFSPGERIVSFTCGEFGNRWADVARAYHADVLQVKFPVGKAVEKDEVYKILEGQENVSGVLITHNETAVGVLNKIAKLSSIIKSHRSKPLLLVDSISALGAVSLPMDDLGIDVLVSASQKAWMSPPGLAFLAVSKYAWEKHSLAKMPKYYFDISLYKSFSEKNQTPATPAVATLFGVDAALKLMIEEGRENIFKRHLSFMAYTRDKVREMKLELFVSDDDASPTVTSITIPSGVDGHEWLKILKEKYSVVLAGGMGETKGKIVRIAHMGFVNRKDLDGALNAVKESLRYIRK